MARKLAEKVEISSIPAGWSDAPGGGYSKEVGSKLIVISPDLVCSWFDSESRVGSNPFTADSLDAAFAWADSVG